MIGQTRAISLGFWMIFLSCFILFDPNFGWILMLPPKHPPLAHTFLLPVLTLPYPTSHTTLPTHHTLLLPVYSDPSSGDWNSASQQNNAEYTATPCCMRLSKGCIWAGAVRPKSTKNEKELMCEQTNRPTNRQRKRCKKKNSQMQA